MRIEREKWLVYGRELKKVSSIAAPMVATTVSQCLLQVVTLMMVGHLGDELLLSGVSMAASFTNVTGISVLNGMVGALETLCGQAYGAKQYQKLGNYTLTSVISVLLICFPISVMWVFTDKLLISIGQEPSISSVARKYAVFLIPNLFASAILQPLIRFLLTQSLIIPLLLCSFVTLCLHIPICWLLVFWFKLRAAGAALALDISCWLNVVLLLLYIFFFSTSCKETRPQFSRRISWSFHELLRLAVPSTVMVCFEWWAYEIIILLSGLLSNPKLETSVISICFTITYLNFGIASAFGATASTRVSNELGGGQPEAAKLAVKVLVGVVAIESVMVSAVLAGCRNVLGYVFSNDKEIVDHIASMWPLICLSIIIGSFQAIFSGVARGSGWQHRGAYVNLVCFYGVGIPSAAVMAFGFHFKVKGLYIGLVSGATLQTSLLALFTIFTNWQNLAIKASERVPEENIDAQI